jgi:hypothetical protein
MAGQMREELLRTLVTNFGTNSALAAKAIREIYTSDPSGFPHAVAQILSEGKDFPGTSFLIAMLASEVEWLRIICDPAKYTLEQSVDLVSKARRVDPLTAMKLAKMLTSLRLDSEEEIRVAGRVMEVLEKSPDTLSALPALRQIAQGLNAHLRSKAVLLIGQINQNPQWAEQAANEDSRVVANAIESLWGMNTPASHEAFLKAAMNPHHRIAANGIVGLYLMAEPYSIACLFQLSRSESSTSRAAAAWTIGRLEDPRFLPTLARMMEDRKPEIRKKAFQGIARIRRRMAQMRAAGSLRVQMRVAERRGSSHVARFLATKDENHSSGLDFRQIVVWNGPDLVEDFSCTEEPGGLPCYELAFQAPPSVTHLIKVQVYSPEGVGEDTCFEADFD